MRGLTKQYLLTPLQCACWRTAQSSLTTAVLGPAIQPQGPTQSHVSPVQSSGGTLHSRSNLAEPSMLPWHMSQQTRGLFGALSKPPPKKFNQRRLVGWTPEQMYQVISDVDQYHKFVPWCQKSVVTKRSQDGSYLEAELEVGFQVLVERYVSKVTLKASQEVQSRVENGMLFHHLDSKWMLEPGPSPNTCWLAFHVDFAFNSVLYNHLAEVFFTEVVQRMVAAFENRAGQLYGPSALKRIPKTVHHNRHGHQQQHQHQHHQHHITKHARTPITNDSKSQSHDSETIQPDLSITNQRQ